MGRIAISALVSLGIVIGLFLLMNSLISVVAKDDEKEVITVDLGAIEEEKKVQRKERRVPKKPPPPKEPPPPQQVQQQQNKIVTAVVNIEIDNLDSTFEGEGLYSGALGQQGAGDFAGFGDGDAIPLATFPPTYPQEAAVKGIQGWVEFRFDISPDGSPTNIKIVAAKPRRVFEKEAKRAIRRWKFKPKMYNGQPVVQTNMRYVLDFKLGN